MGGIGLSATPKCTGAGRAGGFTLIELVAVIIVVGIVAVVGANIMREAVSAYLGGKDVVQADSQAKLAIERMMREIKDVRTPADLTTITATTLTFVDINGNTISYVWTAGTQILTRSLNAGTAQPLADNVSSLAFSYLDRTPAVTAVAANVYYITVSFTLTKSSVSVNYRGTVKPRTF